MSGSNISIRSPHLIRPTHSSRHVVSPSFEHCQYSHEHDKTSEPSSNDDDDDDDENAEFFDNSES